MERDSVISVCSYEGGLVGLSLDERNEETSEYTYKDIQTEYAFSATSGSIQCVDGSQNLLALGGYSEVIRLFDVKKNKDLGELMGEHTNTITCLQFYKNKFLISASEDSQIIIWRCSDWVALHKCNIMNKSPVISMSLHPSGKMLLALYDNGVLRLWNMMEARCNFKRKVGVIEEEEEEKKDDADAASESDADLGIKEIGPKDLKEVERKPIAVKWEPSKSSSYAILYNRMLEIYNLADPCGSDQACATAIFDKTVCCMEFIGDTTIVVSDMEGNLIVLKNILS